MPKFIHMSLYQLALMYGSDTNKLFLFSFRQSELKKRTIVSQESMWQSGDTLQPVDPGGSFIIERLTALQVCFAVRMSRVQPLYFCEFRVRFNVLNFFCLWDTTVELKIQLVIFSWFS